MRFPRKAGRIDQEKTDELIAAAIDCGINYFDTAYIYPGAEEALGKALEKAGKRNDVYIATKLPHYMCSKADDFSQVFAKQLERLRTEWVDYYMMHMLSNAEAWERLKSYGIEQWIDSLRAKGTIRNLGFSFHGSCDGFIDLLDAYSWDFCMVQYNYYDENDQASALGVRAAHERGIPVFVMEPLRGGMLADDLPDTAKNVFSGLNKERTPADWALRWLFDRQEVTMVLSGMSDITQLAENAAVADEALPGVMGETERAVYGEVIAALDKTKNIPCTACGYCVPCPNGVDIPSCFSCYNTSRRFGRIKGIKQYVQVTGQWSPLRSDASQCVKCGICEKRCPQKIHISDELMVVRRRLWSFIVVPAMSMIRKIWGIKKTNH